MKRITLIIILALAVFSFGSCISVDDLKPETPVYQPEEEPEEQPDEQPEDRPDEDQDEGYEQDKDKPLASSATDLASAGKTANCYIVSSAGTYKFKPVKGNSSTSVGSVYSVEVLWESFGTSVTPSVGDLIDAVNYDAGYVVFSTPSSFKKGNAVIAAKDASGTILWSWHIWLTDQPEEQVYYNNAGTMMDRNLGATSATPGDVGALGLLYQWGRKDPFLGSSSISSNVEAKSTGTWPSSVTASTSKGNVDYATANPMTFILRTDSSDDDWHYSSRNNDLWKSSKTIYDPCPAGWRVPDYDVWSNACGSHKSIEYPYYDTLEGMNFSGMFGRDYTIWYPASGARNNNNGVLGNAGDYSCGYWSVEPNFESIMCFAFKNDGKVALRISGSRAWGFSVRCFQEGSSSETPSDPVTPTYENLSASSTANCYIVSKAGDYKFKAVKGNGTSSVGSVASVSVLWESFGTSTAPSVGDLIKVVSYSDGYICFSTPPSFKEGNAVIAAKNSSGEILWSWHIWLTDQPEEQVYYNNAGTMMDRNLGATSATPGDIGALGLLYQWGRKDPFLGSASIVSSVEAESTGLWPSATPSSEESGTIDYTVHNPMTLITYNNHNFDWYYTGSSSTDDSRWQSDKTIYDPCPSGWRVPDGGETGLWAVAGFADDSFDDENCGISFNAGDPLSESWYPAAGYRYSSAGILGNVGKYGYYWSVTPSGRYAYFFYFYYDGAAYPFDSFRRAYAQSVRCVRG